MVNGRWTYGSLGGRRQTREDSPEPRSVMETTEVKPTRCHACGIVERREIFEDGLCYRCVREQARGANMRSEEYDIDTLDRGRPNVVLMRGGERILRYHAD
jgi:hypothetical protein